MIVAPARQSEAVRLVSWNVNSIRSRLPLVESLIDQLDPDVVALQETRCSDAQFPSAAFEALGFEWAHLGGSHGHAGVALLSRSGLDRVQWGFHGEHGPPFDEPRLLLGDVEGIRVGSVYAPNGRRYRSAEWRHKLAWFELLRIEAEETLVGEPDLLLLGDLNVCPAAIDLWKPINGSRNLTSVDERAAFDRLCEVGLHDLGRSCHPDEPGYTWFSHSAEQLERGLGYRLDFALASDGVRAAASSCRPDTAWRMAERPSDHAPLVIELDWSGG